MILTFWATLGRGRMDILNIGCGFNKFIGAVNVDAYECCKPDVVADLNEFLPFEDTSFDRIYAFHVFEHLHNWWGCFQECVRVLRPGGILEIRVPDESSRSALTYRDHFRVFRPNSFAGIFESGRGTNAWAVAQGDLPVKMVKYNQVPFREYQWMVRWCPWLLAWCARHLRDFIWEQRFEFQKQKEAGDGSDQ